MISIELFFSQLSITNKMKKKKTQASATQAFFGL